MQPSSGGPVPEETPLLLAPSVLHELYVWLEAGALDRLIEALRAAEPLRQRLEWEVSALRRCSCALLFYFAGQHRWFVETSFLGILKRLRPTEAGAAMFSAHLQQQLTYWRCQSAEGIGDEQEAQTRLPILERVSEWFYGELGVSPESVAQRSRLLALDTHPCSKFFLKWQPDGSMEVRDVLGPRPREEPYRP